MCIRDRDEPSAGVDVELRQEMWNVIEALRHTGVTIILTTHYIEEAEAIADRVAVINHGELIVADTKSNLIDRLGKKTLTIDLHDTIENLPESLCKFDLTIVNNGNSIDYSYDRESQQTGITTLLQEMRGSGLRLKDLKTEQSSLESIFVELVNKDNS